MIKSNKTPSLTPLYKPLVSPAEEETVFVCASVREESVFTETAAWSLEFVSHSVCPENSRDGKEIFHSDIQIFQPDPDTLGEPKET